jgi:hypothetical protein
MALYIFKSCPSQDGKDIKRFSISNILFKCLFLIPGPKNNTPFRKNRREIFSCKKNAGVGGYFI